MKSVLAPTYPAVSRPSLQLHHSPQPKETFTRSAVSLRLGINGDVKALEEYLHGVSLNLSGNFLFRN